MEPVLHGMVSDGNAFVRYWILTFHCEFMLLPFLLQIPRCLAPEANGDLVSACPGRHNTVVTSIGCLSTAPAWGYDQAGVIAVWVGFVLGDLTVARNCCSPNGWSHSGIWLNMRWPNLDQICCSSILVLSHSWPFLQIWQLIWVNSDVTSSYDRCEGIHESPISCWWNSGGSTRPHLRGKMTWRWCFSGEISSTPACNFNQTWINTPQIPSCLSWCAKDESWGFQA